MKKQKLNPEVYLKAAQSIYARNQDYACLAISWVSHRSVYHKSEYIKAFESVFKPKRSNTSLWLTERDADFNIIAGTHPSMKLGRLRRQIALLFMYEIARDGL